MSKHTPGPWAWNEHHQLVSLQKKIDRDGYIDDDGLIVETDSGHYPPFGADACLIAAAPELLEACQTMIEWDEAENNAEAWDKDAGAAWRARLALCALSFERARAAIAKATGEAL